VIPRPEEVDLVIYHGGCTDGFGAAFAAWTVLGDRATYHPAKYREDPPDVAGKNVLIVDFSYPRDVLLRMRDSARSIIVLDHHKSAMEDLAGLDFTQFDMSCSGAMLSWSFFHPHEYPPDLIRYIQDRDLWQWRLHKSKEYSQGLSMVPFTFEDFNACTQSSATQRLIQRGEEIVKYIDLQVERICDHAAPRQLRAAPHLKCRVVNTSQWISEVGSRLCQDADIAVMWHMDHNRDTWRISLRSRAGVDSTVVSRAYGGGGHPQASGFSLGPDDHIEGIFHE
jgi:oligoribonuclease NrnB/cAMP/cGMP phosphodiesterase (DHH superfamily)